MFGNGPLMALPGRGAAQSRREPGMRASARLRSCPVAGIMTSAKGRPDRHGRASPTSTKSPTCWANLGVCATVGC